MLPKPPKEGSVRTATDHRGLTIFSVLYRVVSAAWWQRLRSWQQCWAHPALRGGLRWFEALDDAWEAQADIELARLQGHPLAGALADQWKYFDMFDADFMHGLHTCMGMPPDLADQRLYLYHNLRRYIKINGHYGPGGPPHERRRSGMFPQHT